MTLQRVRNGSFGVTLVCVALAATLASCTSSGFGGGAKKIEQGQQVAPAAKPTPPAAKPRPGQPVNPGTVTPNSNPQPQNQPSELPDETDNGVLIPTQPTPPTVTPSVPQPPRPNDTDTNDVVPARPPTSPDPSPQPQPQPLPQPVPQPLPQQPIPPSQPDSDVSAGQLKVPTTCYVNMEQGYHGTDEGYVVQLTDGDGVVAAGRATIEAVRNGEPADGQGAYPGMVMNFDLSYVRAGARSGSGTLNVCYADPNVAPELGKCEAKNGVFGGGGDRPSAIAGESAQWTVSAEGGKPEFKVSGNYNLSTHHPVWAYAAPGKCFKDFQSPIVLDLSGNGKLDLVDVWNDTKQVRFDLLAEGKKTRTGWVGGNDALLALDLNKNGLIDDGLELFGEYTKNVTANAPVALPGTKAFDNGYRALAQYDVDTNGVIDAKDPIFSQLLVWIDGNADGVSQKSELKSLAAAGVLDLSLAYEKTGTVSSEIVANNEVRLAATFRVKVAGKLETRKTADVWFKQRRYTDHVATKK